MRMFTCPAVMMIVLALAITTCSADEKQVIGVIKTVKGTVSIERGGTSISAQIGNKIHENDILTTEKDSAIGVILRDDSVISLGAGTQMQFKEFQFEPAQQEYGMLTKVMRGTAVYLSGLMSKLKEDSVHFETPTSICGVRGTHLAIKVEP